MRRVTSGEHPCEQLQGYAAGSSDREANVPNEHGHVRISTETRWLNTTLGGTVLADIVENA
jgi:hypothetical protein